MSSPVVRGGNRGQEKRWPPAFNSSSGAQFPSVRAAFLPELARVPAGEGQV